MQKKQPKRKKGERRSERENTIEDLVKAHFINLLRRPKTQTQPETTASYWENVRRSLLGLECNFFLARQADLLISKIMKSASRCCVWLTAFRV